MRSVYFRSKSCCSIVSSSQWQRRHARIGWNGRWVRSVACKLLRIDPEGGCACRVLCVHLCVHYCELWTVTSWPNRKFDCSILIFWWAQHARKLQGFWYPSISIQHIVFTSNYWWLNTVYYIFNTYYTYYTYFTRIIPYYTSIKNVLPPNASNR